MFVQKAKMRWKCFRKTLGPEQLQFDESTAGSGCQLSEIQSASPEVRLYHTVQALVKGPRGEIASPVVVFTVCVSKEISTEHRELSGSGSLGHSARFVHSVEVVSESPKLSLEDTDDTKHTLYSNTAEQKEEQRKNVSLSERAAFI